MRHEQRKVESNNQEVISDNETKTKKELEPERKAKKNRSDEDEKIYEAKHYKALFDEYVKAGLYYKDFYKLDF